MGLQYSIKVLFVSAYPAIGLVGFTEPFLTQDLFRTWSFKIFTLRRLSRELGFLELHFRRAPFLQHYRRFYQDTMQKNWSLHRGNRLAGPPPFLWSTSLFPTGFQWKAILNEWPGSLISRHVSLAPGFPFGEDNWSPYPDSKGLHLRLSKQVQLFPIVTDEQAGDRMKKMGPCTSILSYEDTQELQRCKEIQD